MNLAQKAQYRMMRLMVRMMPSCKDISQMISEALDHRLPLRKRLAIRLHVSMCSLCRRYEKQLQWLRSGTRHYANPQENMTADTLTSAARERLKRALEQQS